MLDAGSARELVRLLHDIASLEVYVWYWEGNGAIRDEHSTYVFRGPLAIVPELHSWEPRGIARGFPSETRVRAPGCYAYQIDSPSFSRIIVFEARLWPADGSRIALSGR